MTAYVCEFYLKKILGYTAVMGVPHKLVLDNTTSSGYELHIETMYLVALYHKVLSQSCCRLMYSLCL